MSTANLHNITGEATLQFCDNKFTFASMWVAVAVSKTASIDIHSGAAIYIIFIQNWQKNIILCPSCAYGSFNYRFSNQSPTLPLPLDVTPKVISNLAWPRVLWLLVGKPDQGSLHSKQPNKLIFGVQPYQNKARSPLKKHKKTSKWWLCHRARSQSLKKLNKLNIIGSDDMV